MTKYIYLDSYCMAFASAVFLNNTEIKQTEILATKSLGILSNHGPYALVLYLKKENSTPAKGILEQFKQLLQIQNVFATQVQNMEDVQNGDNVQNGVKQLATHLDDYLLFKMLVDQLLIYIRYEAKARNANANE